MSSGQELAGARGRPEPGAIAHRSYEHPDHRSVWIEGGELIVIHPDAPPREPVWLNTRWRIERIEQTWTSPRGWHAAYAYGATEINGTFARRLDAIDFALRNWKAGD